MPRELQTDDGTRWTLAQAYAGVEQAADDDAARDADGRVEVVCTPSGGAQTLRLRLDHDWEAAPDDDLRRALLEATKKG